MHIPNACKWFNRRIQLGYTRPGLLPDVDFSNLTVGLKLRWYGFDWCTTHKPIHYLSPLPYPSQTLKYSTAAMRREHLLNTRRSTYLVLEAGAVLPLDLPPYLLLPGPWAAFSRSQCFWQRSIDRSAVFSVVYCCHRLDWSSSLAACRGCNEEAEQRVHLALALTLSLSVYPPFAPSSLSLSPSHKHTCTLSLCLPPSPSDTPRSRSFSFSYPPYASLPPVMFSLSPIVLICQRWRSPPAASRGCSNSRQ